MARFRCFRHYRRSHARLSLERLERRDLLANLVGHWRADDLNGSVADGGVIAEWTDDVAAIAAVAAGQPRLITNALDGHSVVRFNRQDGVDLFNVAADVSPMSGAEDFTVVVAFATQTSSLNGGTAAWFLNTGLVDASDFFGTTADWGLVLNNSGQVGGGLGQPLTNVYSSLDGLNDGHVHVAVLAREGSTLTLTVDAASVDTRSNAPTAPRIPLEMTFGSIHGGSLAYNGDIAEIRFYDGPLSATEIHDLSVSLLRQFSFVPPRALDDSLTVREDETLVVAAERGVLANDLNFEPTALTATLADPPEHGILSLAADGSLRYQPDPNYFGEDHFTYLANNGADSGLATVRIDVTSQYDPPVVFGEAYLTAADAVLHVNAERGLFANDLNPDRSALQAILAEDVASGELELGPDGSFTYRPHAGFAGSDRFTYQVDDGVSRSKPVAAEILVRAEPLILSEWMAANATTLPTRLRTTPEESFEGERLFLDWIEITNITDAALDVGGFHLTDRSAWPQQWTFPAGTTIAAGASLVVFASGENVLDPNLDETGRLHTNFRLAAGGEHLALVAPDGQVWDASEPTFPPQYNDLAYGLSQGGTTVGYLDPPTPELPNPPVVHQLARSINVTHELLPAEGGIRVTASPAPGAEIVSLELHFRTMFGGIFSVDMLDDGLASDPFADDGVYTALIPAAQYSPGEMVRWFVTLTDSRGDSARAPTFLDQAGVKQSPEYFGAVIPDPTLSSELPIYQLWIAPENIGRFEERAGARGSLSYDGRFYDNILIHGRGAGGSGAGLKFEFNRSFPFYYDTNNPPVTEFNTRSSLGTLEELLALELYRAAGAPHSVVFPMLTYLNGRPAGVVTFIEQPDATLLERNGLDPEGALFKLFNSLTHPVERSYTFYRNDNTKRTREYDPSWDLDELVAGVDPENPDRHLYVMDHINLASVINYLAATVITGDFDHETHNYFAYRDKQGSGEWQLIPWDRNLAFSTADADPTSHPFLGSSDYVHPPWANLEGKSNEQWNRLTDAIYDHPVTRAMFLRRLRTLMDALLQPPETPAEELRLERRVGELADLIRPIDPARVTSIPSILAFLPKRRSHLYVTHSVDNISQYANAAGIPHAQAGNPGILLGRIEAVPLSGNEHEEFIELVNPGEFAVDLSGWRIAGDVELTLAPGTVIVAGGSLFLSPDVRAFRGRSDGPSGGQGLHVQGNYERLLVNSGGAVQLYAADGALIASAAYDGNEPSLVPSLRVSEVHYHPADPTAAETLAGFGQADDFEFIELVNVGQQTIGLSDARLVQAAVGTAMQGVHFAFTEGKIAQLEPGARVLVVEDTQAFAFRYGDGLPVAGEWNGSLSNNRELLTIREGSRMIQQFSYDDDWHPSTDGGGSSLESADPTETDQAIWSQAAGWRASEGVGGTPGFGPPGDLDGNHRTNSQDIDRMYAQLRNDHAPTHHDLNGDGAVDRADVEELVFAILGTTYGDANLDGVVDPSQDGIPFLMAIGQRAAGWSKGDFDGDGVVTASGDGALLLAALSADVAAGQQFLAEWELPNPMGRRHKSTWQ